MQSPIALLRSALEDPSQTQVATAKLTSICRDADFNTCRQIVASLKNTIKNSSIEVQTKLTALEMLHCCAQAGNLNFFSALGTKFIKRLAIMASHRINSDDVERGRDLFGKQSLSSEQNQRASVLFLQKLLRYFVCWANSIKGTTNRGALRIKRHFDELVKKGLKFPQQDPELNEDLMEVMAKCYRAISKLYSMLDRGSKDDSKLEKFASQILEFKVEIEAELSRLAGENANSAHLEVLVRTNEDLNEAMQRYHEYANSRGSPGKSRRQPSSIDLINLLDSPEFMPPLKAPEQSYFDDLMELSIQEVEEPPPDCLRNPEPRNKSVPMKLPPSPRASQKHDDVRTEDAKEEYFLERSLNTDHQRFFETGPGALEEEYARLVIHIQQAHCDQMESSYFSQSKTIENLKVELINSNETIIMQMSEKEALKEIIRAQDGFKRELEQVREELEEKQSRIEQFERKIKILNETLEALQNEKDDGPDEEDKSSSDHETEIAEPHFDHSPTDIVRHFDFSTDNLHDFVTSPPARFSFEF